MRLAAKLMDWRIDIKSEEEKRQETQTAMALNMGAPLSALMEFGLAEATVDALVKAGIGTVEKLGTMTPEQLEALEGIDTEAVNQLQSAINGFYGQEDSGQEDGGQEAGGEEAEAPPADGVAEVAAQEPENTASATMSESVEAHTVAEAVPTEEQPAAPVV